MAVLLWPQPHRLDHGCHPVRIRDVCSWYVWWDTRSVPMASLLGQAVSGPFFLELMMMLGQTGCAGSGDEVPGMHWEQGRGAWDVPGAGTGHPVRPLHWWAGGEGQQHRQLPAPVRLLWGCRSQH